MSNPGPAKTLAPDAGTWAKAARWPFVGLGVVSVALALSACGTSSPTSAASTTTPSAAVAKTEAVLGVAHTALGSILVDSQGRTVYLFASDTSDHSNCTGPCLQYWPIVAAPSTTPSQVTGVSGTIGQITRNDGTKQLTVNGLPLYTYAGDTSSGMTTGQGKNLSGGLWWVVSPNGNAIKTSGAAGSPTPSPSPSSSTTSSRAGGGGWG